MKFTKKGRDYHTEPQRTTDIASISMSYQISPIIDPITGRRVGWRAFRRYESDFDSSLWRTEEIGRAATLKAAKAALEDVIGA